MMEYVFGLKQLVIKLSQFLRSNHFFPVNDTILLLELISKLTFLLS